ncbi:MAG: hypothetical protein OXC05_01520 [Halieaceae bacterium]|nr:hypothetical protein [Halieaceae bacterium]
MENKPRIVIYGAGQYGQYISRFAIESGWSIVAAYNRAGDKVGKDLGELAGIEKLGVVVQNCDTADYSNLEADIGVVTATNSLHMNADAHQRMLGAGLNVICHGAESYYPFGCNRELALELDALAKKNNVTFTGGGIWDMSRIWAGILVAGPCTSIESLFHSSITCAEAQTGHKEQLKMLGIGYSVQEFMEQGLDKSPFAIMYSSLLEHVLVALGYRIKNSTQYVEPVVFEQPVKLKKFDVRVPAGDCVGIRFVSETETEEGVTARYEGDVRFLREDETEHMFWEVDGMPTTRLRTERDNSDHATAACLFNRIPDVVAQIIPLPLSQVNLQSFS